MDLYEVSDHLITNIKKPKDVGKRFRKKPFKRFYRVVRIVLTTE